MKYPVQLNGDTSFGHQPHQRYRVYSVFFSSITCQSEGGVVNILELYEKDNNIPDSETRLAQTNRH